MILWPCVTTGNDSAKKGGGGNVGEGVRELLAGGRGEEVLAVVSKLLARNAELELLLAKLRDKNRRERVSSDQLDLFMDKLLAAMGGELTEADAKLNDAAEENGGRAQDNPPAPATQPAKQPPARRPPPPGLRRADNPIPRPPQGPPGPARGAARAGLALLDDPGAALDGHARRRDEPPGEGQGCHRRHHPRLTLGIRR